MSVSREDFILYFHNATDLNVFVNILESVQVINKMVLEEDIENKMEFDNSHFLASLHIISTRHLTSFIHRDAKSSDVFNLLVKNRNMRDIYINLNKYKKNRAYIINNYADFITLNNYLIFNLFSEKELKNYLTTLINVLTLKYEFVLKIIDKHYSICLLERIIIDEDIHDFVFIHNNPKLDFLKYFEASSNLDEFLVNYCSIFKVVEEMVQLSKYINILIEKNDYLIRDTEKFGIRRFFLACKIFYSKIQNVYSTN